MDRKPVRAKGESLEMTLGKNAGARPAEPWRLKSTLNVRGSPKRGV